MSAPVLEAVQAERGQLEERCAWHLAQLDRLEQQLEALKEIERLAERLGDGTAGEAPGTQPDAARVDGPASAGPGGPDAANVPSAPKPHSHESGRRRREQVLDAIGQGHGKPAEISEATGIAKGGLKDILRSLVAEGVIEGIGATSARRYRLASAGPGPVVLTEAERAGQSQAAKQDKRDARQAVLAALKDGRYRDQARDARAAQVQAGRWTGNRVPFGYAKQPDGRLVPGEHAALARELFERRAAGESLTVLARWLDSLGIRTGRDGTPRRQWARDVIASRAYLGEVRAGMAVNREAHEPLVDELLWQRAQVDRAGCVHRERRPEGGRMTNDEKLLSGPKLGPGAKIRHRRHPELTGRINCIEWCEPGVPSAIPYNVVWDDNRRALNLLGSFWIYQGDDSVERIGAEVSRGE